ncbi:hypothetical protein GCM10011581_41240 [Saccharopolyspora subtropica]|uniref:Transcriptional regulator TetR C-terminal Proteobacteria type domain-containing protein n=1 Tax=Saccharopolyspora thermophila TaxID=89367 RepID=A0A917K6C1_9PSEU|nr:TetR/AcrR family transcriptional regulator C-terminal domain-containing protein [Saccharopolyspora subtropica]GGI99832.1 hypothetical protein GCM10011581_41240 [Saccharopolyspora subtropica]
MDLPEDLVAFSRDRVAAVAEFPDHFALVRTLEAEVTRIPPPVLEEWLAAGPQSAHRRLAPYLQRIADRGLLAFDDAEQAADHFNLLTITPVLQRSFYGVIPLPQAAADQIIVSGVRAFLRLYGA